MKILKCIKGGSLIGIGLSFAYLILGGIFYGFEVLGSNTTIEQVQRQFLFPVGITFALLFIIFYIVKTINDINEEKNNSPS